ncbi:hypothetical protein SAMN05421595_0496 [Austwickia chelonae]|uniref:Uncharacterized protein n=1 Tax=Austwickia chelonae NBRC 105200 TaxID=1184607 RepID=K6V703_9MICO|nr:hypothetical protein AUCHE_08_02260 [Austwickia chelonae NBRC 105200]SEV93639.1 hypothetical protein SAMN05421595_0496 [Austwickia chelonae]
MFFVLLVTWIGYGWVRVVRRRERLITARTVDRFSEHIRVLERRSSKPVEHETAGTSSGGNGASILTAGALARRPGTTPGTSLPVVSPEDCTEHASGWAVPPPDGRGDSRRRRTRAYAFLVASAVTLLGASAASLGRVSWWLPVCAAGAAAALFGQVWWEHQVSAGRRIRRAAAYRNHSEGEDAVGVSAARSISGAAGGGQSRAQDEAGVEVAQAAVRASSEDGVERPTVHEDDLFGGGWSPVPVPRPLYMMKRPAATPEPDTEEIPVVPLDSGLQGDRMPQHRLAVGE